MLGTIIFVLISFFAIIGVLEITMCIVEAISMRSTRSLQGIRIVADIKGCEPHIEFLLGSLSVMAQRISFKNLSTRVFIRNLGVDAHTYERMEEYVKDNPVISIIEKSE